MWLKGCFLFTVLFFGVEASIVATSLSSINWEIQQIVKSQTDRENIVRSSIKALQPKINAAIASMKPTSSLALTVSVLTNTRDLLAKTITLFDYGYVNSSLTCSDVSVRISNVPYDVQRILAINYNVVVNATLTLAQYSLLNAAYAANYLLMTDAQKSMTEAILTPLYLLVDAYTQYGLVLAAAIVHYDEIYASLCACKTYYCTCTTALSTQSKTALATIDTSIRQIQTSLKAWETKIRVNSTSTISLCKSINPDLKTNSQFIKISNGINSIVTLLTGFVKLSTTDVINSTLTCDDLAMKIAYILYRIDQYCGISIQAHTNSTFILVQYGNLNTYYLANYFFLSAAQRTNITNVLTALSDLIITYQQYITTLLAAKYKLAELLCTATTISYSSCNCSSSGNSSAVIASTTLTPTKTTTVTTKTTKTTTSTRPSTTTTTTTTPPTVVVTMTTTTPATTTTTTTTPTTTTTTTTPTTTTTTPTTTTTTPTTTTTTPTTTTTTPTTTPTTPTTTTTTPTTTTTTPTTTTTTPTTTTTTPTTTTTTPTTTPTTPTTTTTTPTTTTTTPTTTTTTPTTTTTTPTTTTTTPTTTTTTPTTTTTTSTTTTTTPTTTTTTPTTTTTTPTTTPTTTTTRATTTVPVKLCAGSNMIPMPLYDSTKTYIKSACLIPTNLNQAQAEQYCVAQGMHFFVVDSNETQQALFNGLTSMLGTQPYVIRVDGLRDEAGDGNWYNYAYGKTAAYAGLMWVIGPDTYTGQTSMVVTDMAYPMVKFLPTPKIDGLEPDLLFPFACEYKL